MTGEPRHLRAALGCAFGERMAEAVKRPLLQRRPNARNPRRGHRRIKMTSENNRRGEELVVTGAREDEFFDSPPVIAASRQQLDDVGNQVDVTSLQVLRRTHHSARVATPDSHQSLGEVDVDVSPAERQELTLSHPRLEGKKTESPIRLFLEVGEESRELFVLEVGSLLPLGARSLCMWELENGVRVGVPVEHRRLQARTQYAQVLGTSRGRATALPQVRVKARNVLGSKSGYALALKGLLRMSNCRAIRADRRRLPLERGEPVVSPFDESDRWSWPIRAIFDGRLQLM